MPRVFFDTNILVYACDMDQPRKRRIARALMREPSPGVPACISTQVVQEFYVTATRKLGIEPLRAKSIIRSFLRLDIVTVDVDDIHHAIEGNILWQVSFWDALIIVAAQKARCSILYTEDFNAGQAFDGITVTNPFA